MRLFIAMNFPASVRRSIAAIGADLKRIGVPARWVPYGDMHLTLKFLGELPSARLDEVAAAMQEVAFATGPVLLRFGRVGAFPSPRRPRVIWVGLDSGPRLRLLHDALDRRMAEFGVGREDRPFRPHVTVGRADRNAGPGEFRDFERHAREMSLDAEVRIERIDLMESRLRHGGAEYQKLASSRLVGV
jgi:2'-5' RNA ligase